MTLTSPFVTLAVSSRAVLAFGPATVSLPALVSNEYFSHAEEDETGYELLGQSAIMENLRQLIRKVARTQATVLISLSGWRTAVIEGVVARIHA